MWASRDSTNQSALFVEWFSRLERAVFRGVYGKIYVLFQAWKFSKSLSSVMSFRKHSKILSSDFGTSLSRDAFSTASRLKWGAFIEQFYPWTFVGRDAHRPGSHYKAVILDCPAVSYSGAIRSVTDVCNSSKFTFWIKSRASLLARAKSTYKKSFKGLFLTHIIPVKCKEPLLCPASHSFFVLYFFSLLYVLAWMAQKVSSKRGLMIIYISIPFML